MILLVGLRLEEETCLDFPDFLDEGAGAEGEDILETKGFSENKKVGLFEG